ncbi:hypothetical protein OH76DRAFT_1097800 [Lentinus brumalis]|uniref:Uncharacterized protein n=1 Tax=Lentinus brumalis TaxID=2498619 RepID=A0A371CVV2_9APHY|nr:hypothetical protein OH76DRAFT_1097800 [Polyporus brumalis]
MQSSHPTPAIVTRPWRLEGASNNNRIQNRSTRRHRPSLALSDHEAKSYDTRTPPRGRASGPAEDPPPNRQRPHPYPPSRSPPVYHSSSKVMRLLYDCCARAATCRRSKSFTVSGAPGPRVESAA